MTAAPNDPKPTAKPKRVTIDLLDFTLAELDGVAQLERDAEVGRLAAYATIHFRRTDPTYSIEAAKALTMRDVKIVETDPDDETPTDAP